jgi:hypothetical protein
VTTTVVLPVTEAPPAVPEALTVKVPAVVYVWVMMLQPLPPQMLAR